MLTVRNSLGFVVNVAGAEATYYLRLSTASKSLLSLAELEPVEVERVNDRQDLRNFFPTTLALLVWALHGYLYPVKKNHPRTEYIFRRTGVAV